MRVVTAIAATTIGEAIRRKIILVILLIGVLLCAIAPGLQVLSARQETTVLRSFIFGVMQLTGAAIAIVLTVYLIPTEIERRTIYTILCKPVRRWQFLLGKYLGAIGALGMMMMLMTLVSILLYKILQRDANMSVLADLAKVPLMFYVQMCLLAAIAVCLSTFVTPLVNFFLSAGVYMVGTVFSPVFKTFQDNPGTSTLVKAIGTFVVSFIPNFARFNVQNASINTGQNIGSEFQYYLGAASYGIAYITAALVVGMIIFEKREV